jgi:hypothetical protein
MAAHPHIVRATARWHDRYAAKLIDPQLIAMVAGAAGLAGLAATGGSVLAACAVAAGAAGWSSAWSP